MWPQKHDVTQIVIKLYKNVHYWENHNSANTNPQIKTWIHRTAPYCNGPSISALGLWASYSHTAVTTAVLSPFDRCCSIWVLGLEFPRRDLIRVASTTGGTSPYNSPVNFCNPSQELWGNTVLNQAQFPAGTKCGTLLLQLEKTILADWVLWLDLYNRDFKIMCCCMYFSTRFFVLV